MKRRFDAGFTLIEVIVVAGIIAVLAGILVPLIFKEIDESKNARAQADVKSIASAMIILKKDTGSWPVNANCTPGATVMRSPVGDFPTVGGTWDDSNKVSFDDYINADTNGCWSSGSTWKGPYMAMVGADPWGREYISNAKDYLSASGPIWIISAGPNGVVETASNDAKIATSSDDIGVRVR